MTSEAKTTIHLNMAANVAGQIWGVIMMIAFVPLYIRAIGIEAYGLIGFFATLQVLMTLLDAGLSPTLNRETARYTAGALSLEKLRDLLRTVEIFGFSVAAVAALVLAVIAPWIANHWLQLGDIAPQTARFSVTIMGVVLALRFVEALYRSTLFGLQYQAWYNGANAILNLLRHGGSALVLLYLSPTIEAFFLWHAAMSLVAAGLLRWKLLRVLPAGRQPARASLDSLRAIQGFALGMLGINLLAVLLTQSDKLLLSKLLPLAQFAHYSLANTMASMLSIISMAVCQALLPVIVLQAEGDNDALPHTYHRGAQIVSALVMPPAIILMLFPADVLMLWSGNPQLAAAASRLTGLLAAGYLLNALMVLPYFAMLAYGWTRLALVSNFVAVMLLVPAILILVPRFGMEVAAIVWVFLNLGYVVIQAPLMHRNILKGELRSWYARDIGLPFFVAFAVGYGLMLLRAGHEIPRVGLLFTLAGSYVAILFAMLPTFPILKSALAVAGARLRGRTD